MRFVALLVLVACSAGPSYVRDPDGHPLPTTARLDADMTPATVHCNGTRYLIVEPPPPYLSGNHLSTVTVHVRDAVALCARIRAED